MWYIWQVSNTTLLTEFMNSQTKLKIRFPKLLLVFASYQHVVQLSLWVRKTDNRVDIGAGHVILPEGGYVLHDQVVVQS